MGPQSHPCQSPKYEKWVYWAVYLHTTRTWRYQNIAAIERIEYETVGAGDSRNGKTVQKDLWRIEYLDELVKEWWLIIDEDDGQSKSPIVLLGYQATQKRRDHESILQLWIWWKQFQNLYQLIGSEVLWSKQVDPTPR